MKRIAIVILCGLSLALAACGHETWHLVSGEKGNPAEIRLKGGKGDAFWSWGPATHSVGVTVEKNDLTGGPTPAGGVLRLRMADGTPLEFRGEHGALVCAHGCDGLHMPVAWLVQRD
ncbi:hypothetical protein SAMN02800694_3294 [Luteibacter sp. UNCMF331Sha3.1]|uniref:hypothetical protein n=1 Tax=Luteibacter sp. UNCMF331Sha3.1 TaxID=1502760 RepID=UPI0008B398EE|nr:hypothetical protein [Luteibacter sp. UNCMF331Sha3.1]SEN35779.1 hypothetical protein SAMN02800694_3294 [Luteibacter sp. UNCMF331Sha3.1]